MNKLFVTLFLIAVTASPQSSTFDFQSPQNIKIFADYLFCEGDYIRAIEEYGSIRNIFLNDTINFKIMLCYTNLNLYNQVFDSYLNNNFSEFINDAQMIYLKTQFMFDSSTFRNILSDNPLPFKLNFTIENYFQKLRSLYFIETRSNEIEKQDLLKPFDLAQKKELEPFIDLSLNPGYKNPALAGTLSAIIPGSGKMYVGEWGDGITALIITSLFAFLTYDNFKADHTTRAWIFAGLGAFFYAGNIYGSIASAQIFNARIDFDFSNGFNLFLQEQNYFLPEYDFCN